MKNFAKKFKATFVCATLILSTANARADGLKCEAVFLDITSAANPPMFHQLPGLSLSDRFAELKKKYGSWKSDFSTEVRRIYNYEVYRMLQEAFYPMLRKFTNRVQALNDQQIQSAYLESIHSTKIEKDKYTVDTASKGSFPNMSVSSPDWLQINLPEVFRYNLGNFARHYSEPRSSLGNSEEFVWMNLSADQPQELGLVTAMQGNLVTQVGDYGSEFSEKLLRTTQIMRTMFQNNLELRQDAQKLVETSKYFLQAETARMANDSSEKVLPELAPISSGLEGILSLHQLFSNVLAKRIPGDATGTEALREVIFNGVKGAGLVSEITTRHPMGVVGPMALSGSHFPEAFVRTPDGKLALSAEMIKTLQDFADKTKNKSRCPMAGLWKKDDTKTGLQELAEAYWKIYLIVDKMYDAGQK